MLKAIFENGLGKNKKTNAHRKVTGSDALLLVVPGSVAGELQQLCRQVLQHSSHVHAGALSDARGVPASLDETGSASHRECETRLLGVARSASLALLPRGLRTLLVLALRGWRRHFGVKVQPLKSNGETVPGLAEWS